MKKILFLLGLALVLSGGQSPASITQAAELQSQVIPLNNRTLPRNGVRIPFLQVNLRAIDGPVEIRSLTVKRSGLSTNDDFGRIWAETDNYRRTNSRQLGNDDKVELEFRTPLLVAPDQTERLTIYANLEFEGGGRTASLNVIAIDHSGSPSTPQVEVETKANASQSSNNASNRQVPVFTKSKSRHDRTRYKIQCKNQVCQLVPRS